MSRTPQKTRIDWAAARAFYCALDPTERTFARVAREYRVTSKTVREHAHAEGWLAAAAEADRRAAAAALRQATRSREHRAVQTVRIRDAAADRLEGRLKAEDVELDDVFVLRAFEIADRMYRLDVGEATDRVAISEVQVTITALLRALSPFIPADRHADALAAIDVAVGGLVAVGAGGAS